MNTSEDASNISQAPPKEKYGYVVDTEDKTIVDPGTVNELCKERDDKILEQQARSIRNPVSVGKIGQMTNLALDINLEPNEIKAERDLSAESVPPNNYSKV
jgi:hypothetical protein